MPDLPGLIGERGETECIYLCELHSVKWMTNPDSPQHLPGLIGDRVLHFNRRAPSSAPLTKKGPEAPSSDPLPTSLAPPTLTFRRTKFIRFPVLLRVKRGTPSSSSSRAKGARGWLAPLPLSSSHARFTRPAGCPPLPSLRTLKGADIGQQLHP